jgi:hypothetical protein
VSQSPNQSLKYCVYVTDLAFIAYDRSPYNDWRFENKVESAPLGALSTMYPLLSDHTAYAPTSPKVDTSSLNSLATSGLLKLGQKYILITFTMFHNIIVKQ